MQPISQQYVTTTITTPMLSSATVTLRLRPVSARERWQKLVAEIRGGVPLTKAEESALAEAEALFEKGPAEAVAHTILHVLQAAIRRRGEDVAEELFVSMDALTAFLETLVPAGETAETFLAKFEAEQRRLELLSKKRAAQGRAHEAAMAAMCDRANAVSAGIDAEEAAQKDSLLQLQGTRLSTLRRLTGEVTALSATEAEVQAQLQELAATAQQVAQAILDVDAKLQTTLVTAATVVRRI